MRSEEFLRRAIIIIVNPTMVGGSKRLMSTAGSEPSCEIVRREIASVAPRSVSDAQDWARWRFDELLAECFVDDAWHSALPSGAPLVLVKEGAIEGRMDIQEALRRVHMKEISRALSDGEDVPSSVLDDYRALIEAMATEREVI